MDALCDQFTSWNWLGLHDPFLWETSTASLCSCTNKHCKAAGFELLVSSFHCDICRASAGILASVREDTMLNEIVGSQAMKRWLNGTLPQTDIPNAQQSKDSLPSIWCTELWTIPIADLICWKAVEWGATWGTLGSDLKNLCWKVSKRPGIFFLGSIYIKLAFQAMIRKPVIWVYLCSPPWTCFPPLPSTAFSAQPYPFIRGLKFDKKKSWAVSGEVSR